MSNGKVLTGAERKTQILEAGAQLASELGAVNVTRRLVAQRAGCAEALVSAYMGNSIEAQAAYAKKAKAMKLKQPSKEEVAAIGAKMRKHKPRDKRDTRKRSAREIKAIKNKIANPAVSIRTKTDRNGNTIVNMSSRRSGVDLRDTPMGQAVMKSLKERETKPTGPTKKPARVPQSKPVHSPAAPVAVPSHKTAARAPKKRPTHPVELAPPLANKFP